MSWRTMQTELPNEFYPLLAGYYDQSDLPAYQAMWVALRALPVFSRNLLTSDELPQALKALSERFGFQTATTTFVSILVRKMIFREWDEAQARAELTRWLEEADPAYAAKSEAILTAVKQDILTIIPPEEGASLVPEKRPTLHLTLLEALAKYPQLGQQTITETRIKLKASTELVRGSLINWLKCYREELGVGYHDAMLRGQFLFRSQNGARLTTEEHGRIDILLRSIEDREAVEIDAERQIILFPPSLGAEHSPGVAGASWGTLPSPASPLTAVPTGFPPAPRPLANPVSPPHLLAESPLPAPATNNDFAPPNQAFGTLHFSSKQVLPVEKVSQLRNEETLSRAPGQGGVGSVGGVAPVSSSAQTQDAAALEPLRPTPAPKRSPNIAYIPTPYRIDPAQRGRPEQEV